MKKLQKIFAWVSILSLILQISSGFLFARPAFAQEESSPPEGQTEEVADSSEPVDPPADLPPTEPPALPDSPDSSPPTEPEEIPTPTPSVEVTPTETPPEPPAEPPADPNLIIGGVGSAGEGLDLGPEGTDATSAQLKPSVSTDKEDYAPGETVKITGENFPPNTTLLVKVTRPDGSVVKGDGSFEEGSDEVVTDEEGRLEYLYQLNGIEGEYVIEVFQGETVLATKVFTDTIDKVTICHATSSHTNPYNVQQPNKSGDVSGHDDHNGGVYPADPWGDIIPPFDYDGGSYPGKNWTTEGQAIWNNDCVVSPPTPACGNGQMEAGEQCDGEDGVTLGVNFCTHTCELVPIYDGSHTCPDGTVRSEQPVANYSISSTDLDGETFSVTPGQGYLFEALGTFIPTGAPGYVSDAGYTLFNGLVTSEYGIQGTPPDLGAHALLGNFGSGVGIIDWGTYNPDHVYTKYYEPAVSSLQFLIGDRYDNWFDTPYNNQSGMSDNSGSLTLNIYECQQPLTGSIQGRKYEDVNANGVHDNATEDRLNGWTIRLYDDGWNKLDEKITGHTGQPGQYRFEGLNLGTHYVCEVLENGWTQTGPTEATLKNGNLAVFNGSSVVGEGGVCWRVLIDESGESNIGLKFGNFKHVILSGYKVEDVDGDGDPAESMGEPKLNGWTINLEKQGEGIIETAVTGDGVWPDGYYEFVITSYGIYTLTEVEQAWWVKTYPSNGYTYEVTSGRSNIAGLNFLNYPLEPEISIAKTNDHTGGASAGDTVNYTLTLTNGPVPLIVDVIDVMPDGFNYVVGSAEVDGVPQEPTISGNVLTWSGISFGAGDVIVITYQAKIDGSQPAGTYYNLATCFGSTGGNSMDTFAIAQLFRPVLTAECGVVESNVPIGEGVSTSTSIGGTVLGVTTEAVLGAATGSETYWLVLAFLMILAGISIMILNDKKKKALLLKKLNKLGKKFLIFAVILFTFFAFAGSALAAVTIKVADLPEYKRTDNFKLYYTVLDTSNPSSVNAIAYVRKDSGFGWKTFGGTQTDPSGFFEAFGHDLDGDGTYRFYVQANGVNSSEISRSLLAVEIIAKASEDNENTCSGC